ncbi:phage portal protein family protein [Thermospira aquatica]|uniref:DUF935 family protein n=1 Tax=Thermospira aquatica TaxID=2828656 RepID=A0AAX3BE20_9SPIR|nr:DUF935 family protein [Thermospira aquatica]URA10549.1 DUF935 family protein [Thermospira aquatica]
MLRRIENEIYTRQKAWQNIKFFNGILPDPEPILKAKGKDFSIYKDILFDSHVDACITSRMSGVLAREYDIVTRSSRRVDKKLVSFIRDNFYSLDLETIMKSILNAIYFGFSVLEKIYSTDGNFIYIENLIEKPQEWFAFDEDNKLIFKSAFKTEKVDENKVELIQHNATYINPYGDRKLSKVFWPVSFKRGGIRFWVDFAEKFGSVFLYGKTTSGEKRDEMAKALEDMIQNAVGVFESTDEIYELNVEKGGSSALYSDLLNFCNSEISKSILGQTLTTEEGRRTGSYAQAKVHFEVRQDIIESDCKFVKKYIDRIIRKLVDLNFKDVENYPEIIFYVKEKLDIDTIVKLKQMGVKFTKDFFVENFNLKSEQFSVDEGSTETETENFSDFFEESEYEEVIKEERRIDDFVNKTFNDFKSSFESFLNDVNNAINDSENYDEAISKLLKTLGKERDYNLVGKLLLTIDLLTRNELAKSYNFSEKYVNDQINFLKMKVPLSKDDYNKLPDKYKNYGFTVARYQEEDKVAEVLDKLIKAKEHGLSYKDFKKSIGKVKIDDSVYFQNVRNAQMSAKYQMLKENTDIYPYWQYVAIMDGRTRPSHVQLNGKVYRADDQIWNTIYPPNGFGCRCTVRPLSEEMIKEKGLKVEDHPPDFTPDEGFNNVGEDLKWIETKQNEAVQEEKDKGIIGKRIELKNLIKKEGYNNPELLITPPEIDEAKYRDKNYLHQLINSFCNQYGFSNTIVDITDYQGKVIKLNYRELVQHIVEDSTDAKDFVRRTKRLRYIRFIPEILKNPDSVVAKIYVKKHGDFRTKVSKQYVKKIQDNGKEIFILFATNYDRESPNYRGATLYFPLTVEGWIIK